MLTKFLNNRHQPTINNRPPSGVTTPIKDIFKPVILCVDNTYIEPEKHRIPAKIT